MLTIRARRALAVWLSVLIGLSSLMVVGATVSRNGSLQASDQGTPTLAPTANSAVVTDPAMAVPIDGQPHIIPGHTATWYKIDYAGTQEIPHPIVNLRLVNGFETRLRVELWSAENVKNWWDNKPFGQGTQEVVLNCRVPPGPTSIPPDGGPYPTDEAPSKCVSNDLIWSGAFGGRGVYYVRIVNENDAPMDYVLIYALKWQ